MASAAPGDFQVDALLTGLTVGYRPTGLVGTQLFPEIRVNHQTGIYAKVDKGNWFRVPTTIRAPGTQAREVAYTVSSGNYSADNHALATFLPYESIDNAADPYTPLTTAGQFLMDQLMLGFETRIRDRAFAGVGSTTTLTGINAWNDYANSAPLDDLDTAVKAIRRTTGKRPNLAVIGQDCWLKLKRHPDIVRAAFPGAGVGGIVSPEQFGGLIGVSKILIPEGIQNGAEEGQADSFTDVWSTNVLLAYVAPAPGILQPSFGYTFHWTGPNIGASAPGNFQMLTKNDDERGGIKVKTGYYQDENVVAPELGFQILTGIV